MKIGVLSDTHDRDDIVPVAIRLLRQAGAEILIHCGDITSPDIVGLFEGDAVHFVFGNCDTDLAGLRGAAREIGGEIHDPFGSLELDGRKIAWTHGHIPAVLQGLIESGDHDFVFHGHTHVADHYLIGATTVINPGALHRARPKSCGVLDLADGSWESIVVGS